MEKEGLLRKMNRRKAVPVAPPERGGVAEGEGELAPHGPEDRRSGRRERGGLCHQWLHNY